MPRSSFDRPTGSEMFLRKRLGDTTCLLGLYEKDASGKAVIEMLEAKITALEAEVDRLQGVGLENTNLSVKNRKLMATCSDQKKQIAALKCDLNYSYARERELECELKKTEKLRFEWAQEARALRKALSEALAENRKLKAKLNRNPQNSSLPPSSSPIKKVHNSRVKTGRRPGGQVGHEGHGRRRYVPDEIISIEPIKVCPNCGSENLIHDDESTRCITDIIITLKTTGFSASACTCKDCQTSIKAPFPEGVVNEQNYGNNIRAISTYLMDRCNVSGKNVTDFLYEVTGHELKISTGSVRNFLAGFSKKSEAILKGLRGDLLGSCVIGSDATHTSESGKQTYVYVFVSDDTAIYKPSKVKGKAPLEKSVIDGYGGTVVHDHDKSYYSYGAFHAECNAHILRTLTGVAENEPERMWALRMKAVISEAIELANKARKQDRTSLSDEVIRDIESRYDAAILLAAEEYARDGPFAGKYKPEGIALACRLRDFRDNHLLFLHDLGIPSSNNFSERALRRVKMKTKQSGGFRSHEKGQLPYCDFLSITQTASMRGMEVLGAVRAVFDKKQDLFSGQV